MSNQRDVAIVTGGGRGIGQSAAAALAAEGLAVADPGFVEAEETAQFIRLVATGQADDLAGQADDLAGQADDLAGGACSIYDTSVRSRLSATASDR